MKARHQLVEVGKIGGGSCDAIATRLRFGELLEGGSQHFPQGVDRGGLGGACQIVDGLLCRIDELLRLADVAVALCGGLLAKRDHAAKSPLLLHRARVVGHVVHSGCRVGELREVTGPTYFLNQLAIPEPGRDRHDVDGARGLGQLNRTAEDRSVRFAVEMLGLNELEDGVERIPVQETRRKHRRLGVEVMRRRPPRDYGRFLRGVEAGTAALSAPSHVARHGVLLRKNRQTEN